MNKRAATQYLTTLFGDRAGHVAVAYKDKGQSWQECQFSWPSDHSKLIGWAEVHKDANIFVCPALRQDAHTRKKGDMQSTRWLWADVDWQSVPPEKREQVRERIGSYGSIVVQSGTTDPTSGLGNVHVYVELSREVDHAEFIKLNTGLRDYLYADNKQADNSLLRLPGTTNWKTDAGSPVVWSNEGRRRGKGVSPESLMKLRPFRDAKVIHEAEASDWAFIEVEGLPRRVKAMVEMDVAQAESRYGSRYKAVWAVTGELHRRGFDGDAIHSLMDKFPPALDKMAEENGYDVHRDVDKRLAWDRAKSPVEDETEEDEDAGDVFEEMSVDEMQASLISEGVEKELLRRSIRKAADIAEAERGWTGPPDDVCWGLRNVLRDPPPPAKYLIGVPPDGKRGLCGIKHNVIITAQYKTGKTKFVISTIAKALCDDEPFMGDVPVHTPEGGVVVGHWNCEMDPDEMAGTYVIPAGIQNVDNLRGADLRGHRVNILSTQGRRWAVQWLRGEIADQDGNYPEPVKVWTIDSFARLARMAGVSEKDNDEVMSLLMALDEIKVEAEVDVIFLITHTGRGMMEEGKERARGATAIDDWCDARWIMTEQDGIRFLAVDGRGVGMDAVALVFDEETGHSTRGLGGKADVKADGQIQAVVRVVKDNPGISATALAKVMKLSQRAIAQYVEDAIAAGFIEVRKDSSGRGRPANRHYLVNSGPVDGDRARKATPQEVVIPTRRRFN